MSDPALHDEQAESAVIGSILQSPAALREVIGVVKPSDFFNPKNEEVFAAALELFSNGEQVEPLAVMQILAREGKAARIGGATYLYEQIESVPTVANVAYWAKIVSDKSQLRRVAEFTSRVEAMAKSGAVEPQDLLAAAYGELDRINGAEATRSFAYSADESFTATLELLESLERDKGSRGVLTGFPDLDHAIAGLRGGQMIVIAARPGIGKTTLAMDIVRNATIYQGKTALFFTLEMSHDELMMRMTAAHAQVDMGHMRSGSLTDDEWQRIVARGEQVRSAKLFINDSSNITTGEIKAHARRLQSMHGLDLIVVDYLQLMSSGKRVESRQQEVSEFSRSLKLIAKELNVPVIAVSQLNRGSEGRTEKRPQLSDLRESGSIEQDSDLVMLIYREDMVDPDTERVGEADIIIAKQRSGPTGVVPLAWQGQYGRFASLMKDF